MAVHLLDDTFGEMSWVFVPAEYETWHPDDLDDPLLDELHARTLEFVGTSDRQLTIDEALAIGQIYGDMMGDERDEINGMSIALRVLTDHIKEGRT